MSKPAAKRRLADSEASAYARALRGSARKLNLVAQMMRGKSACVSGISPGLGPVKSTTAGKSFSRARSMLFL